MKMKSLAELVREAILKVMSDFMSETGNETTLNEELHHRIRAADLSRFEPGGYERKRILRMLRGGETEGSFNNTVADLIEDLIANLNRSQLELIDVRHQRNTAREKVRSLEETCEALREIMKNE